MYKGQKKKELQMYKGLRRVITIVANEQMIEKMNYLFR
jgi:hypothetical protein